MKYLYDNARKLIGTVYDGENKKIRIISGKNDRFYEYHGELVTTCPGDSRPLYDNARSIIGFLHNNGNKVYMKDRPRLRYAVYDAVSDDTDRDKTAHDLLHKISADWKVYFKNYSDCSSYSASVLYHNPHVKRIVYNDPATIVFWTDGTKTVVKCSENETFNPYFGFCAALAKKLYGNNNRVRKIAESGYWQKEPEPVKPTAKTKKKEKSRNG